MNEHVFLVEDDPSIREVVGLGLTAAGFRVTTCGDGREGLMRQRQEGFDVVILDVMLPSLDGFEVCREIRKESRVPIVMLTARADTVDIVVGLESGADDYVPKPFEMPELVARVRAVLRRATAIPEEVPITLGRVEIDPAGFSAKKDGQDLALTATEFEATVSIRILDENGKEITRTFTNASCGTGCRGDYSTSVRYSVSHQQSGTVEVYEVSAKNGSAINVQDIPVILTP
jgi:two-component system response regulator MtrA